METLPREASAFWFTWNKTERVTLTVAHTLSGSAAFVSLSSANDFGLRSRAASHPLLTKMGGCWRSARARHEPRRPVGLARRASRWRKPIYGAVLGLVAQLVRARA